MKLLLFSFTALMLLVCKPMEETTETRMPDDSSVPLGSLAKIQLGTNAKGTLKIDQQIAMADKYFEDFGPDLLNNFHIRLPGGTRSQRETTADWSDAQIKMWVDLQKKHNFNLIWVVNGNDPPQNQKAFIQRWMNMGGKFSFIEMMNEYYLPKYAQGKLDKAEVTRKVTAEDYAGEILEAYLPVISELNLPIFVHVAPKRTGKQGQQYAHFNSVLTKAVSGKYKSYKLGVAVHLYEKAEPFDYGQIAELRAQLPPGTPLAITEAGNLNESILRAPKANETVAPHIYAHYRKLAAQLKPGDYLIDHTLYNDYKNEGEASLHPNFKGVTPKGKAVLKMMHEIYPPK
jgi:hypothetical protein